MFDDLTKNFFGDIDKMFPEFGPSGALGGAPGRSRNTDLAMPMSKMLEDFSSFRNFDQSDSKMTKMLEKGGGNSVMQTYCYSSTAGADGKP